MQEFEQQAYAKLVHELLNCPDGQEQELLAMKPELVNEKLLRILPGVIQYYTARETPEMASKIDWLVNFALGLEKKLNSFVMLKDSNVQIEFLLNIFQMMYENNSNSQLIYAQLTYPLIRQNLELFDEQMIEAIKIWASTAFLNRSYDFQSSMMKVVAIFGDLIQEFPYAKNKGILIELAITCYDLSIQVFTLSQNPQVWSALNQSYGMAFRNRITGDKAENLEAAIYFYSNALTKINKENNPVAWSSIHNNLGNVYIDRIMGDIADNLEMSISCYNIALEVRTKNNLPFDWAMTQNNLANVYRVRIKGIKTENLQQSVNCYILALEIYNKDNYSIQWAMTQNNLANVYYEWIGGDTIKNLGKSMYCYKSALEVRTKDDFPVEWAETQNNLSNVYRDLGSLGIDRQSNMELSINCLITTLDIYNKESLPLGWAMIQYQLARNYGDRIEGDRKENIYLSIKYYKAALTIYTPYNIPIQYAASSSQLGDIYFELEEWQNALKAYENAMYAVENSRNSSVNDKERQRILSNALSVYESAIQCAIQLGNIKQAIEYTERIRSRQLVELMASRDLSNVQAPTQIQSYIAEYHQLSLKIENIQDGRIKKSAIANISSDDLLKSNEEVKSNEVCRQELYEKIRAYDQVLAGQIAITPINFNEIQHLIVNNHTAILTFYTTNDDTNIFILKQNQEPAVFTIKSQGKQELQAWLVSNWLIPYNQNNSQWQTKMPKVLAMIADRLQIHQLIDQHLTDIQEIILVPHLLLHQIPFAALPIKTTNQLLGERFTIRSIPSCQILQYCQQRPPISVSIQGIVEDADNSLIGARYEGQKIAEIYNVPDCDRLRGKTQATVANYRQLLSRVSRLHSSHHAKSRLDNPLESALFLANGKITLGDLLLGERYPDLDEIFLSACETHVGNFTPTDDVATLTTGFLCTGARSVQSTLWSVNDLITAIFDVFYHQERFEDYNRAVSLQRAQERLRNLSGEEFRINHCPKLQEFLDIESKAIKQRIEHLTIVKDQSEGIDATKNLEELEELKGQFQNLENLPPILDYYGQQPQPFISPYYWAGFICQGMA
jgi:CHAT domain-containing protein